MRTNIVAFSSTPLSHPFEDGRYRVHLNNRPRVISVTQEDSSSIALPARSIEEQLHRILASKPFAQSARMSRFLRFTVERALPGQSDQLQEYLTGVDVVNRKSAYDPPVDPNV